MTQATLLLEFEPRQSEVTTAKIELIQHHVLTRCSSSSRALLAPLFQELHIAHDPITELAKKQSLFLKVVLDQDNIVDFQIGLGHADQIKSRLYIDFNKGKLAFRLMHQHSLQQAIFRAVGVKSGKRPAILDCNAGLGRDALLFAAMGCEVKSIERHPLLFLSLDDALRRCRESNSQISRYCNSLQLQFSDAEKILHEYSNNEIDTVYLDPMFPTREKSAKVKLEAQLLQYYCNDKDSGNNLLRLALDKKFKRICVKRPLHAPFLGNEKPDLQYKGKSTRFDVYFPISSTPEG